MSMTKELVELLKQYPNHELIFMYPEIGSDNYYTMGTPSSIIVDEYWTDDERVWLRLDNECDIREHYADNIFDDLFPTGHIANEEQIKVIDKKTEEFIEKQDWKKCICVYIQP